MIDLFLKVLENLVVLAKERQSNNRNMFEDFVSPAMESFEETHKAYLQSFQRYLEINKKHEYPENIGMLVHEIHVDMIHTHPDRKKLDIVAEVLAESFDQKTSSVFFSDRQVHPKDNNPFSVFVAEILEYIASISNAEDRYSNIGRGHILTLIQRHERVEGNSNYSGAKEEINEVILRKIDEITRKYSEVQTAFQKLKVHLLKPL